MNETSPIFDSKPPSDLDSERAVLGAVILDPNVYHSAAAVLVPEDFYLEANRIIWRRMADLAGEERPVDPFTLRAELQRRGELETAGGVAYVASLTDGLPRAVNVEHYAALVREAASRRRLIQISQEATVKCLEGEARAREVLESMQSELLKVAAREEPRRLRPMSEIADEGWRGMQWRADHRTEVVGLPTGLTDLDRITGGLRPGDFVVIAARPSMGKTSFCLNVAAHVALRLRKQVAIFSLEMSREEIHQRMLCAEACVDSYRVRNGRIGESEWQRMAPQNAALYEAPMWIDDSGAITLVQLRARSENLRIAKGLDLVVVDYLGLMEAGGKRYENKVAEVTEISRGLKRMARELNVPVLCACQLNRQVETRTDKRPQLSDLRESGAIEQDADLVVFIYREEYYRPESKEARGAAELIVAKQRNGPTGLVHVSFISSYTKFTDGYRGPGEDF